MKDRENTTEIIERDYSKTYTQIASDVNQTEVWQKQCESLHEETDRSMTLIDSTAKDLHSYMRGMFANDPNPTIRKLDADKVFAAVQAGKTINDLMKTKLEAINTYRKMTQEQEEE